MSRGVESWLDVRSFPVRLLLLAVPAIGCMLFLVDGASAVDWTIAMAAVVVAAMGVRRPFVTAVVVAGLLLLGFEFGDTGPVVPKVAAAVTLVELSARRGGWPPFAAAGAVATAYVLHPTGDLAANSYRAVVMAGAPLVIGGLLRAARESTERAEHEARELARRRDSEVAAARALERTAIARELHDLIAHHVSSTVLRVGVARHALTDAPPVALEVLDDIHASGKETLADLRRLVAILRDPAMAGESFIAPADLPAALDAVVTRARQLDVTVTATVDEEITVVDAVLALTLLRLTQEGIANIVEHAGPGTSATLTVTVRNAEAVRFSLRDSGFRFGSLPRGRKASTARRDENRRVPSDHGLGLIGLRERVELLGGELTAGPSGPGWLLTACLPLRDGVVS
ncbi:sensor histidine kinase [Nocardia beijingensis]|uniref:sensor histidine kinase n=1 Tax=Nocardia beijingensis TaxID=95162 RepID=UPI001E5D218E|nr:histidine kinase [Nocardia beijingensis]